MAPPTGATKRKRGDRSYSGDSFDGSRPSPHRPASLNLAQQSQASPQYGHRDGAEYRGRGNRRGSRGGGAGRGAPRSPHGNPHSAAHNAHIHHRTSNLTSQSSPTPTPTPAPIPQNPQQPEPPKAPEPKPEPMVTTSSTQTPPPDGPPTFFTYDYLKPTALDDWNGSGRALLISQGVQARKEQNILNLSIIFQELVRSSLDGRIRSEDAGSVVKDILEIEKEDGGHSPLFDPGSIFLDTLTMFAPNTGTKENQLSKREVAVFKPLLLTCGVPMKAIFEELEIEHLSQLGLTRSTFERMRVRFQTQILYRQSNYNLLREESEGYSKLITELFTTSGNEPPSADVVAGTFERVKAMIGAFDLDVGRVLDITLDIFAAMLVRKYRFFVKYLRASTWWPQQPALDRFRSSELCFRTLPTWALPTNTGFDGLTEEEKASLNEARLQRDTLFWNHVRQTGIGAFFELGGRKVDPKDSAGKSDAIRAWIETTGIVPPVGNKVAAQVLGFKLRFYNSPARSASDVSPPNLIFLSALLIKIGFITLEDLYPHLWPSDEAMPTVKEQKMEEKEEREKASRPGGSTNNALAMAGALTDDTVPGRPKESAGKSTEKGDKTGTDATADPKDALPEPADQKVQLLKSLLCIGALPEALFMLGRFPWLMDAFLELPEHIHRILHHCLSKVYEPLQPLKEQSNIRLPHTIVDAEQSGVAKGHVRRVDQSPPKTKRWAQLDKFESDEGINYVFYWDDWADNIPICQTVDDVFTLCNSLLPLSGVKIGQDPALLTKFARIGKHSLATDISESNKARWIDLLKRLLVPALSLTKRIPSAVEEIWELIKHFPTHTRFSIYAEWYYGTVSRNPDMKAAFDHSRAETKDCLKRISKTNVKPQARILAKIATSSPGIVFSVAISQIESYDNLVDVIVECGRYFTFLGYDVLTWSLMNALGTSRTRVQADGMLTSMWLRSLADFSGKVLKRYGVMSPTPILQYVLHQLQKSNPTDLIVLEHIVSSMAGIVSDTDLNDHQVSGMAGGKMLQSQILLQLLDRRHEMKVTAKRLMKSLVEPKLVGPLLIAIAQERQTCVFQVPEMDAHLKLLGNLFDKIHRVLVQYLDLLRTNLSIDEFRDLVPSVDELIGEFGLDPSVAFWISRPTLAADIAEHDKKTAQAKKVAQVKDDVPQERQSGDVEMLNGKDITAGELETVDVQIAHDIEEEKDTELKDSDIAKSPETLATPKTAEIDLPWHPVLQKTMEATKPCLPSETFGVLSDSFYFTFWQMSLEDVYFPVDTYAVERKALTLKLDGVSSDRSDLSRQGTQKKEEEKKAIRSQIDHNQAEMEAQLRLHTRGLQRLGKEKRFWFEDCWGKWDALNVSILEHCFIPRITLSPMDALYTFKMLKILHSQGTKYFRTVGLLDQLFNKDRLTSLFFLSTNREADNIGRFVNEVLKELADWHSDKSKYEFNAHGSKKNLPGFCVKFNEDRTLAVLMDYEDFRRILYKWHTNFHNALKACFQGGEYMHIRNAIAILKACTTTFPVINWIGTTQVNTITELSSSEKRDDLKLAARALLGHLKRRENTWVTVQAFMLASKAQLASAAGKGTSKSNTPQPEANNKLNAKAPEFKPRSPANANGSQKPTPLKTDKIDLEDGEVKSAGLAPESAVASKLGDLSQSKHAPEAVSAKDDSKKEEVTKKPEEKPQVVTPQAETLAPKHPLPEKTEKPAPLQPPKVRDSLARPDSRSANLPSVPPRPSVNGRASSHSLPNRPDAPPTRSADRRDRPPERHYPEDIQAPRYLDHRSEGLPPPDYLSQRDHGYSSGNYGSRHERERQDSGWANANRISDARYDSSTTRETRLQPRDERLDRSSRDRPTADFDNGRSNEVAGRQTREGAMPPPRPANPPYAERAFSMRTGQDDRLSIHPDRRTDAPRLEDYTHPGSQRSSRGPSPVRRDDRSSRPSDHSYRDERAVPDNRRVSDSRGARSHYEDSRAPSGPRGERATDQQSASSQSERFRESFSASTSNSGPPYEPNRSRYPPSDRAQQESSFGRLNADPPSGPRTNGTPATRGGRAASLTAPHVSTQSHVTQTAMPSPAVPEKQTPTGPASDRAQTRPSGPLSRPGPGSGPPTPSAESPDTAGVHPDRLKAIQGTEPGQTAPRGSNAPAAAPSGPRGPANVQPSSPVSRGPTVQQYPSNDRSSRSDRRFAGVNSILQQPGQPAGVDRSNPGTSIRGRGSRGANIPSSPVTNGPPLSKDVSAPESLPPVRDLRDTHPSRQESFADRSNSGPAPLHFREDDRTLRDSDRRSSGRHDARSDNLRQYPGPPPSLQSGPAGRMPRDDTRQPPRRIEEPVRREDIRETRSRSGAIQPHPERDFRRPPRDELVPSGRDMHRDREGRRDSGRDEWPVERMPRDRRDIGPDRRDSGPSMDPNGSFGRRKRGALEDAGYDQSKRSRR